MGCVRVEFQKALHNLRSRDWGPFKKRKAVAMLLGMSWKEALRFNGFSIDEYGFPQMLSAIRMHVDEPGIRTVSEEVERQLKFPPGALFSTTAGSMKGSPPILQRKGVPQSVKARQQAESKARKEAEQRYLEEAEQQLREDERK